ncbi:MAG: ribonuclease D [Scytonematopsis contorta HA4267-MV1]|jgi:ribonuclease D|nr:ribonuclease D [Scytonematopsis contorta HA4267-MV1]
MSYLTSASEISSIIKKLADSSTLWIDTEVADYNTRSPKLSLIQVLDDPTDLKGDRIYILDVLDQPEVISEFIDKIMLNPGIEKVFHNAKFDVKFLGKNKAKNITCTLEMAKSIPYYILPLPNYQLKTLATELCGFINIDKGEQTSDWGQRPLSYDQIEYAYLDCIYLAQVHQKLLSLGDKVNIDPAKEDLIKLSARYKEIEEIWRSLDSEVQDLKERIKSAMQAQDITETPDFKISSYNRSTTKVAFSELARFIESEGMEFDFPITLTQKLQKDLGGNIEKLPLEIEENITWRLTSKTGESEDSNE